MNSNYIITDINRVIFVGKDEYQKKKIRFTESLHSNELIYHFNGEATIYFNGKILETRENTIRFLPKGVNQEYIADIKEMGECIDVFFGTDSPIYNEAFSIKLNNNVTIGNLFKKLFAVWVSKNDGYYFECISLLYKIFAEMQKHNYIPQNQYDAIKPAIDYIENNFLNTKIPITLLTSKCQISESYLKKLFIKKFGVSPIKYIINLKINHACDLLCSKRYSITQVAHMCGYDDVCYFSRQFKKIVGTSPSLFVDRYISSK